MSILSINSTYKTKTVDNTAVELRLKKDGRFLVNEKHVQFTPISVLANRLNLETEYDKVVLVLRHSVRPLNDWSTNVELTDLGKYSASLAGKHLNGISTKFKYFSTDVVRTKQTAYLLYKGRNEVNQIDDVISSYANIPITWQNNIYGLDFIKDQSKYEYYTSHDPITGKPKDNYRNVWYGYIYGTQDPLPENKDNIDHQYMDVFNDITYECERFITTALTATQKFSIIVSHDQNVMPLVAYATDYLINFKKYGNGSWLNFLSGIAILQKGQECSYIPISGLATGYN